MHTRKRSSFVTWPKFIVTWPLILAGFILPALHGIAPTIMTQHLMLEIWIVTLIFVSVAMGFDFPGLWSTIIALSATTAILLALFITAQYDIPILGFLLDRIRELNLSMSADAMMLISYLHALFFVLMIIVCNLNHRWIGTLGKIERFKFLFRRTEEFDISQQRRVTYVIHDVLEYLLTFGGAHLIVKTGEDSHRDLGFVLFAKAKERELDVLEVQVTATHPH
jgi:hypothetical protein